MSTHTIVARRKGRGDKRYSVGQVIHAPKVTAPGGGPDGHYYVILRSRLHAPDEDLGHYDWTESAEVRAATDAEVAAVVENLDRAWFKTQIAQTLNHIPLHAAPIYKGPLPARMHEIVAPKVSTPVSGEQVGILDDGSVVWQTFGDPEMMDAWYKYHRRIEAPDPKLIKLIRDLIASEAPVIPPPADLQSELPARRVPTPAPRGGRASVPEVETLYAAASPDLRDWIDAHRPRIVALAVAKRYRDIVPARLESLTIAAELGADAETLKRLADAIRVDRADTIVLPFSRYAHASRGKSWCRSGTGSAARWGKQERDGFRVGPGKWLVHSDDGFKREDNVTWDVENIHVGDQVWTLAY